MDYIETLSVAKTARRIQESRKSAGPIMFSLALTVLISPSRIIAQATPSPVSAPWQQVTLPGAFASERTFPVLGNGYLSSHARQVTSPTENSIFLTSLRGQQLSFPFYLPGASTIRLEHADVSSTGHVLVAGAYVTSNDHAEELISAPLDAVNFVAEMDLTGKILAVRNLGDYTPERVCGAPDGTYWTLGQVWSSELAGNLSYAMVRQFSSTGTLMGSYLPRSALPQKAANLHEHLKGAQYAFLRCGSSSVAAYIGSGLPAGLFTWIEVNRSSGKAQISTVGATAGTKFPGLINGLVLVSPGVAYATFSKGGLYRLIPGQSNSATWTPVPSPIPSSASAKTRVATQAKPHSVISSGTISYLLGWDGTSIVHLLGEPNAANTVLYWTTVTP